MCSYLLMCVHCICTPHGSSMDPRKRVVVRLHVFKVDYFHWVFIFEVEINSKFAKIPKPHPS